MKKFIVFLLMAIMVCSCGTQPTIKKEKIYGYDVEMLFGEAIPSSIGYCQINEYNENGQLILTQLYDEDGLLYAETKKTYTKGKFTKEEVWIELSSEKWESLTYKENGKWYVNKKGVVIECDEIESNNLNNYNGEYEEHFKINNDYFEIIHDDVVQCLGKITEKDEYDNWIKAVGKINDDNSNKEEHIMFVRELTYF